ncbi:MAG: hypothetical protein CSB34_01590 [Desulfobulbus propionicus]|nr:MAG: hypothetical protein CSB34_01590 [Desulfobulbus propionicus]
MDESDTVRLFKDDHLKTVSIEKDVNEEKEHKMKKRKYIFLLAIGAIAAGLIVYKDSLSMLMKTAPVVQKEKVAVIRPVPTVMVREANFLKKRDFPGSVRARNRVDLAFSVAGLLVELNAREGEQLSKGDVLAKLDPRDFQNALASAQASYDDAKRAYMRARDLFKRKVLSQAQLDATMTAYEVAEANLRQRNKDLSDTVIYAPFDGVVAKRYVENHEHIRGKSPVASFKDLSRIEVVTHIPENLVARVGIEEIERIQVRFDVDQQTWYPAEMKEHSMQSDPVSRTYDIVVSLEPPKELEILPGMTATVEFERLRGADDRDPVYVVPAASVLGGNNGESYVWVIPEQSGHPEKVQVELGALTNDGMEIVGGLGGNERVATAAIHTLLEDMLVRPAREGKEGLDR